MLNEIIKRIYESGEYAGIYANAEDTSKFMYGRIVAFDGEFFAASLVSPDGAFDGITVQDAMFSVSLPKKPRKLRWKR